MSHNKKISIFILTRKRPNYLRHLLKSMEDQVSDVNNLEIWMGLDEDDDLTPPFLDSFLSESKLPIQVHINDKKSAVCAGCKENFVNRHADLLFPMTEKSTGDYLWILNDDVIVATKNFDEILIEQIETHLEGIPDRLMYAKVDEIFRWGKSKRTGSLRISEKYACYPLISRELYDTLGWFLPPAIPKNGADITLAQIMGRCVHDRFVEFFDIHLYDQILENLIKEKTHKATEGLAHEEFKDAVEKVETAVGKHSEVQHIKPYAVEINFVYACKWCSTDMLANASLPTSNVITCPRCQTPHFIVDSTAFPGEFHEAVDEMKGFLSTYEGHVSNKILQLQEGETEYNPALNITPSMVARSQSIVAKEPNH